MKLSPDTIIEKILFPAAMIFMAIALIAAFVYAPVALYTEAECLRSGYPKAAVTIGLERYCMTLDGAVTVKVDKIK